jgi:NAD(P)H-hydrate repair Nnr-like enzyme with NAD(P)H-hydrate dehydratase domain
VLLTPHAGELATLLTALGRQTEREQVEARPLHHARIAAELTGATVLLKGQTTLVVDPPSSSAGRVRSQADATPWLATAGAGDVLAGIAGALLAGGLDPLDAGSLAALVHGRAARAASRGGPITAGDVAESVPHAVRDLLD